MINTPLDKPLATLLSDPLRAAFDYVRSKRDCPEFSDFNFAWFNIQRSWGEHHSGRDMLQYLDESLEHELSRSTYFDALHSERRRTMIEECSAGLELLLQRSLDAMGLDHLSEFPALADCEIWGMDGHHVEHACHDRRTAKDAFVSINTIYGMNLRNGLCRHFCPVAGNGKHAHEWPAFKQTYPDFWKTVGHARKVIMVGDMAFTDKQFWCREKWNRRAVLITRMKENTKPCFAVPQEFDPGLPINIGVLGVYLIGLNNAGTMRLVEYENPETGELFRFITTDDELEPGLVAWLYFLRWRIEKLFDTMENKLHETKAWASGRTAQVIQATCISMAHNLLVYLGGVLDRHAGITERKLEQKRQRALDNRAEAAAAKGRSLHPFLRTSPIVQLSLQFIRTVRNLFFRTEPLRCHLPRFRKSLGVYL